MTKHEHEHEIDTAAIRAAYAGFDLTGDVTRLCDALDAARAKLAEYEEDHRICAEYELVREQEAIERAERADAAIARVRAALSAYGCCGAGYRNAEGCLCGLCTLNRAAAAAAAVEEDEDYG